MDLRIDVIGEGFNENIYIQLRDSLGDLLAGYNIFIREAKKEGFERLYFFPKDYEGPFKGHSLCERKGMPSLVVFHLDLRMDIIKLIKGCIDLPEDIDSSNKLLKIKEQCSSFEKNMMNIVQRVFEMKKTFYVEFVEVVSGSPKN